MNSLFRIKVISGKDLPEKNGIYYTCKLGDQKFKGKFGKVAHVDFLIAPSLLDSVILLRVHSKGIFRSELIGQIEFPVFQLLEIAPSLFSESKANYYSTRGKSWAVKLKLGFLDEPSKEFKKLFQAFNDKWAGNNLKRIGIHLSNHVVESLVIEEIKDTSDPHTQVSRELLVSMENVAISGELMLCKGILRINIFHGLESNFQDDILALLYFRNNVYKTRCLKYSEGIYGIEGLDIPILEADYEANAEIVISVFENSSFLPHSPIGTIKLELRALIQKFHNDLMENEPSVFEPVDLEIPCYETAVLIAFKNLGGFKDCC